MDPTQRKELAPQFAVPKAADLEAAAQIARADRGDAMLFVYQGMPGCSIDQKTAAILPGLPLLVKRRAPDTETESEPGIFRIPNSAVSERHCEVYKRGDSYFVRDLGSTNGTYINDVNNVNHTVTAESRIAHGENLLVGWDVRARFYRLK